MGAWLYRKRVINDKGQWLKTTKKPLEGAKLKNLIEHAEYEIKELLDSNMTEQLGADVLIENLAMAMSYDELKSNLEYIDRMHDLDNF